ncbi:hypothetical protein [Streptomyces sp. TRM68367]|uniref:hypothetical protein n=1 Tax=Streptomyces sp. TRM68367 TaxID=2758415 RepID=UPI0037DC5A7C
MATAVHVRYQLTYLFPVVIDGLIAYGVRAPLVLREAPRQRACTRGSCSSPPPPPVSGPTACTPSTSTSPAPWTSTSTTPRSPSSPRSLRLPWPEPPTCTS